MVRVRGQVNEVTRATDIGLKGGEREVEIQPPGVVNDVRDR